MGMKREAWSIFEKMEVFEIRMKSKNWVFAMAYFSVKQGEDWEISQKLTLLRLLKSGINGYSTLKLKVLLDYFVARNKIKKPGRKVRSCCRYWVRVIRHRSQRLTPCTADYFVPRYQQLILQSVYYKKTLALDSSRLRDHWNQINNCRRQSEVT